MRMADPRKLACAARELGNVAFDPSSWPRILEQISEAAGGTGAVLLQSDTRTSDVPHTPSVDALIRTYFADGWHLRDIRAARCVPRMISGSRVVTDQDIFTRDELRSLPMYNEGILPHGFQWFAAVGFLAGSALWGLSIQRGTRDEPFSPAEAKLLATLSDRLTEIATLSTAFGRAALSSATCTLSLLGQPAIAIDRSGAVLDVNGLAALVLDNHLYIDRHGRIGVLDARARVCLQALFDRLAATPDTEPVPVAPIVVRRDGKRPLVIRALPIHGAARTLFNGARALLILSPVEPKPAPDVDLLCEVFGLTRAEADVAALVARGKPLAAVARRRGSALVTVRNQLRTIFAKTGTHRQSELAALLARL
jgi:DNA-binding CsgD family transcriptional regulator